MHQYPLAIRVTVQGADLALARFLEKVSNELSHLSSKVIGNRQQLGQEIAHF